MLSVVAAAALLLAACSSSSKNSTGSSSTAPSTAATTATPTKSTVTIAALIDISGPSSGGRASIAKVVPAWEKYINAKGGLNGHPVKIDIRDVNSDAATAQSEENSLLQEHPIAWLIDSSATESAQAPFLGKTGIPIIGAGYSPVLWGAQLTSLGLNCSTGPTSHLPCAQPNAFTVTTTFGAVLDQAAIEAKAQGATKIVDVVCAEIDSCSSGDPELKATAKKIGLDDVGLVKVSSTAPSYTTQCVQFIQEKVDWIELSINNGPATQFAKDCLDQGYTGWIGALTQAVCCGLLQVPNVKIGGGIEAFPWWVNDAPVQEFRAAMTAGGVANSDWQNSGATGIWTALQMFAAAQKNLSDNPTASEALQNMYSLQGETLGGLAPPITFTQGQPAGPRNCFWPIIFKNGSLNNPIGGLKYECYPAQS